MVRGISGHEVKKIITFFNVTSCQLRDEKTHREPNRIENAVKYTIQINSCKSRSQLLGIYHGCYFVYYVSTVIDFTSRGIFG